MIVGFAMIVEIFMVLFLASGILLKTDDIFKCTVVPVEHLIIHSLFHIQPARVVLLTVT